MLGFLDFVKNLFHTQSIFVLAIKNNTLNFKLHQNKIAYTQQGEIYVVWHSDTATPARLALT